MGGDESVRGEGLPGLPAPHHVPQVLRRLLLIIPNQLYTDKKENLIFLVYKEIQNGAVAKSNVTNGLLIYDEIFAHFLIY